MSWKSQTPFLMVAIAGSALTCQSKGDPEAASRPRLVCDATVHDFGPAVEGEELSHVFRLRNEGAAPAYVTNVQRSPSCAASAIPAIIPPGASTGLDIRCTSRGRQGQLADFLAVFSDDPSGPLRLQVRAKIEPRLAFETNLVELEVAFGERRSLEIHLVGSLAPQARLTLQSVDAGGPMAEIVSAGHDQPAGLRLTLVGDEVRIRSGRVLVATGFHEIPVLGLPYAVKVSGNLQVSPSNPYFNLRDPEGRQRLVTVTSARRDFRLRSVEVVEGPFAADSERVDGASASPSYVVRVSVVGRRLRAGEHGTLGKLVLVSNDPAEPRKEIPLFALGVLNRPEAR